LTAGSVVLLVAADPARHAATRHPGPRGDGHRRASPGGGDARPGAGTGLGDGGHFAAGAVVAIGMARFVEGGRWSRSQPRAATQASFFAGAASRCS